MLVLTRKTSERIQIGKDIVVTVVEIRGNKVRLGIQAPKDVAIDREEVAELKRCEAFLESLREDKTPMRMAEVEIDFGIDTASKEGLGECDLMDDDFSLYATTLNPTSVLSSGSPL